MSSNLPPGVTVGHPHLNPPDTSHEHEWEADSTDYPIIEDGAAIFIEHCRHETVLNSERGYRGERVVTDSIPCEETRSYRFEYDYLEDPEGNRINLPPIHDWSDVSAETEDKVLTVERSTWESNDENPDVYVDPDQDTGEVVIEHNGFTLRYAPQQED